MNSPTQIQMKKFPKDRRFFLLSKDILISKLKSSSLDNPNYIIVFYEDSKAGGNENIFNYYDFAKNFYFIKVSVKDDKIDTNLNFLIEKENFNNGREISLTTEIKKRKSIIEEIKKIHKVNLNQNLTFMTRYENTINSIYNLFFFLTFTKDNHKPQPIKNNNNQNIKDNNINNGANQLNLHFNYGNPQNPIMNANNNNPNNNNNNFGFKNNNNNWQGQGNINLTNVILVSKIIIIIGRAKEILI